MGLSWGDLNPVNWGKRAYGAVTQPNKDREAAAGNAAANYYRLGVETSGQYRDLQKQNQDLFNPAQWDLNAQRANRPKQQNDYYNYAKGWAAQPTNEENALGTFRDAAGRPTKEEDYLDYYKGFAGKDTNQETLLKNDTYGNTLSDVENLYQRRMNGDDPAAAYEDTRATEALNNQAAARGGYNSGAGIRSIGDYYSNVGAQRSKQLADLAAASSGAGAGRAGYRSKLAGGADTSRGDVNKGYFDASAGSDRSRLDVNDAYGKASAGADTSRVNINREAGDAAAGASKEQADFFNNMSSQSIKLASERAGINEADATKAIQAYTQGNVASIQAALMAAGYGADAIEAFQKFAVDTVNGGVKTGMAIGGA